MTEGIVINVEGFSEEKKKRVQDAFFKLGVKWGTGGEKHQCLNAFRYGNVEACGRVISYLILGSTRGIHPEQKPYEHTYNELMKKAGMEEYMEKPKPTDEVTITTTYGDLAKVYAVMGNASGQFSDKSVWRLTRQLFENVGLDDDYEKYQIFRSRKNKEDIMRYGKYQKEWEELLFGEEESEQQIKARELEEEAERILQKAKELRGSL